MKRPGEPRASGRSRLSDARRRGLIALGIVGATVLGGALHLVGVLPPG